MIEIKQRKRLHHAGVYANQNGLSLPYTGTKIENQRHNQRALLLLEDGSIVMANRNKLFREINPATGELLSPSFPYPKGKLAVLKVNHRPNHDSKHAYRAAYQVPVVLEYFRLFGNTDYQAFTTRHADDRTIERLQYMMMFSVIGRQDETGFNAGVEGRKIYEQYRADSAKQFIEYCRKHHFGSNKLYKNEATLLQDALIVELMGYPDMPEIEVEKPHAYVYQLMQAHKPKMEQPETGFNPYLDLMNVIHALELMRCYKPFRQTDKKPLNEASIENVIWGILYKSDLQAQSDIRPLIDAFLQMVYYAGQLIEQTGDRFTTELIPLSEAQREALLIESQTIYETHIGTHAQLTTKLSNYLSQHILKTKDNFIDEKGHFQALQTIRNCQALIHTFGSTITEKPDLHDARKTVAVDEFKYWLDKLEDTVNARQTPYKKSVRSKRELYSLPTRQFRTVRTQKPAKPAHKQEPVRQARSRDYFFKSDRLLQPGKYSEQSNRGNPVNTIYTPKTAHSLLRPDGLMLPFL